MKKLGFLVVLAALLLLAPTTLAADGSSSFSALENLLGQLIALFWGDKPELGLDSPPNGQSLTSEDPELGLNYPPNG